MKETTLLKIALLCSFLGLIALYFASENSEYKNYVPSALNKNVGDDVKLIGIISGINNVGEVTFIEIKTETPTTIVIFNDGNLTLNKNDKIEVLGEVQDYKGKEEIIVQRIRVIK